MKPFVAAEQLYDKQSLIGLREQMITLRDAALTSGQMEWSVILSHTVAVMAHFIEEMEG